MTYQDIRYEVRGRAGWVTIHRPEVMNALRWQTGAEINDALRTAVRDETVRFIVLTGEGPAFCAGDDVKQVFMGADFSEQYNALLRERDQAQWVAEGEQLVNCPKPTIAAVNGVAVGSGMDLALQCDLRIASESARFASLFVRMGVVGTGAGLYFLPRIVGLSRAYELLLSGRWVDALEAERIGLVSRTVPADQLVAAVEEIIDQLSYGAPLAQRAIKKAVQRSYSDWRGLDEYSMWLNKSLLGSADHREAAAAFVEKRRPKFTGR